MAGIVVLGLVLTLKLIEEPNRGDRRSFDSSAPLIIYGIFTAT